jgi:hypothetical protein
MDTFNNLSVMVSIILGVGLSQIFGGIGNLLPIRHRVKQYRVYKLWVLIPIVAHVHLWWSFWALRDSVEWNYAIFLIHTPGARRARDRWTHHHSRRIL